MSYSKEAKCTSVCSSGAAIMYNISYITLSIITCVKNKYFHNNEAKLSIFPYTLRLLRNKTQQFYCLFFCKVYGINCLY